MAKSTPFGEFKLHGDEILLAAIALHEVTFTDAKDEHQHLCKRIRRAVKKRMPVAYEKHLRAYELEQEAQELEEQAKQIRQQDDQ